MVFSSTTFLFIFLPVAFLLNLALKKSVRAQNVLLMLLSIVFYAWGEPVYVLLMIASTLINYLLAFGAASERPARAKLFLILAVLVNIGVLTYYKYADFLVSTFNGLTGLSLSLPGVALPIGVSFFTFQALSYVIDVYRRKCAPEKNYLNVLLYISFFPQLIAGPIVKYHDISEQIISRTMTLDKTASGARRFAFGLAKKVLVANILARVADSVYALSAPSVNAPIAWLGAIAYLMQIYFDFSGYSDMAIGLGRMFGFGFLENFNYPYISLSMQDFWRRWHISLSTWFKEYVYIPLGGNRKGKLRTGLNKVAVFFLTGLWHGASWNFVIWGLFHGLFLLLESYGVIKPGKMPRILRRIYTLAVVTVGFVFFRADTLPAAWTLICSMFGGWRFGVEYLSTFTAIVSPLSVAALLASIVACTPVCGRLAARIKRPRLTETLSYCAAFLLLILSVLALSSSAYNPFIYFRF